MLHLAHLVILLLYTTCYHLLKVSKTTWSGVTIWMDGDRMVTIFSWTLPLVKDKIINLVYLWDRTGKRQKLSVYRMKCPFTVILVSTASEIMEPAVFLLKESHHWLLKRKEKVTILLIEYFRLYVILNLYSISGVLSWEVYMGCFPWSVTGQVESSRHYGIMPVHYEFWSSMKRRNEGR